MIIAERASRREVSVWEHIFTTNKRSGEDIYSRRKSMARRSFKINKIYAHSIFRATQSFVNQYNTTYIYLQQELFFVNMYPMSSRYWVSFTFMISRYWRLVGSWARGYVRHISAWACKARWYARHIGKWVRKHARHFRT